MATASPVRSPKPGSSRAPPARCSASARKPAPSTHSSRTAAGYFDRELEYKLKRFTALFEPAIIVFMGVVVGFVAIAMVSAMYGVYNQVEL